MSAIFERYKEVLRRARAAAVAASRDPDGVQLLAVSKTFPAEAIRELYDCGVRSFGESRIPELSEKASQLPGDIEWHFIGRLQSNKARRALQLARVIHSVDSVSLLERLERIAGEEKLSRRFLLEVNVSGEASKAGFAPAELAAVSELAANCRNLEWAGLMTMAPDGAAESELHAVFAGLRELRDRLSEKFNRELPLLSMGMSGDFEVAVAEGATLIRVGSSIFGRR